MLTVDALRATLASALQWPESDVGSYLDELRTYAGIAAYPFARGLYSNAGRAAVNSLLPGSF